MLKFEATANVGDIIKAYDFQGADDMFLSGRVIDKGDIVHPVTGQLLYCGYTVEVLGQGELNDYDKGEIAYVPFETTFDYDGRVELVATQADIELLAAAA